MRIHDNVGVWRGKYIFGTVYLIKKNERKKKRNVVDSSNSYLLVSYKIRYLPICVYFWSLI